MKDKRSFQTSDALAAGWAESSSEWWLKVGGMLPRGKGHSITTGVKPHSSAGASGIRPAYNQPYLGPPAADLPQLEYPGFFIVTDSTSKVIFQSELILKTNTKMVLVIHAVCWKYSPWSHGFPHPLPFFFHINWHSHLTNPNCHWILLWLFSFGNPNYSTPNFYRSINKGLLTLIYATHKAQNVALKQDVKIESIGKIDTWINAYICESSVS